MSKIVLFDIDYTMFDTKRYKESSLTEFHIYEEVAGVLADLGENITVGVFSEGEREHQLTKLLQTEIKHFFAEEHVHIFTKKLESLPDVLMKYAGEELYFIDDKLKVLRGIKQSDPAITTIWVKRGAYAEAVSSLPDFTPDATISDLKSVSTIIHNAK